MSSYAHGRQPLLDAGRPGQLCPRRSTQLVTRTAPMSDRPRRPWSHESKNFSYRAVVSAGGVRVPDVRGKEFDDWLVIGQAAGGQFRCRSKYVVRMGKNVVLAATGSASAP